MKRNYRFADTVFEIDSYYEFFHRFAKEYATNDKASTCVSSSLELITSWKESHDDCEGFSLDYIETLVIHSLVADTLAKENKFIFHGSAIAMDNLDNCYIFTAPSGTGKSTHVNLLRKIYGNRISYVNDDKPFISNENSKFFVYGSPWNGKERLSNNVKGSIKGVFVIRRSNINKVIKLASKEAITYLVGQMHFPKGELSSKNALDSLISLVNNVPIYLLEVNMDDEAAKTSFEIMRA